MPNEPCISGDNKTKRCPGQSCAETSPNFEKAVFQGYKTTKVMDPFSISLGTVALAGTFATATSRFNTFHSDYQNTGNDSQHIQLQKELLQINQSILGDVQSHLPSSLHSLGSSLADIEAGLPAQPCSKNKRDKFRWAACGGKRKAQDKVVKLKEIESSTIFALSLTSLKKWGEIVEIKDTLDTLVQRLSEKDQELILYKERLKLLEASVQERGRSVVAKRHQKFLEQNIASTFYYWDWILRFGISLKLITSHGGFHDVYTLLIRWPLYYNMLLVLHMRITRSWPVSLYITLTPRTEIPSDSTIIKACQQNDTDCIRKLLCESPAHVNDTTRDGMTLLRVAIHAGHLEVVKLLLDNKANPNQVFGTFETSPLNIAFRNGRADIIRLLYSAKGDLNYVNTRAWTSVYYLWDPDRSNHSTVSEILDICGTYQFHGWNTRDRAGWAPVHRAAAFGKAEHIEKLFNMRAVDQDATPLTVAGWSPLQCAVRYGNLSTFQYLTWVGEESGISFRFLANLKDKNGWTLLHLAAASGSEEMIALLLAKGLDPNALSDPATLTLPEELDYRRLSPRDIAEHYGFVTKYDNASLAYTNSPITMQAA